MNHRKLAAAGARLEEAVAQFPNETDPLQRYLLYEQMATCILDSEHSKYPEEALENYLRGYMAAKQVELGVDESQLT